MDQTLDAKITQFRKLYNAAFGAGLDYARTNNIIQLYQYLLANGDVVSELRDYYPDDLTSLFNYARDTRKTAVVDVRSVLDKFFKRNITEEEIVFADNQNILIELYNALENEDEAWDSEDFRDLFELLLSDERLINWFKETYPDQYYIIVNYARRFAEGDYVGDLQDISKKFCERVEELFKRVEEEDYSRMRIDDLKALLRERGLSTVGRRDQLIARLENN